MCSQAFAYLFSNPYHNPTGKKISILVLQEQEVLPRGVNWLSQCHTIKWERQDLKPGLSASKIIASFDYITWNRKVSKVACTLLCSKPKDVLWKHFLVPKLLALAAPCHKERAWQGRGAGWQQGSCLQALSGLSVVLLCAISALPFSLAINFSHSRRLGEPVSSWAQEWMFLLFWEP